MGWADDMYAHGLTYIHGGVLKEHDDEWLFFTKTDHSTYDRDDDEKRVVEVKKIPVKLTADTVIRNCKFKYQCPMRWSSLEETSTMNVRYCSECKRTVHYCETDEQLRIAILEDHCVAVKVQRKVSEARSFDDFDDDDIDLGLPF